jgi:hypothetical protein
VERGKTSARIIIIINTAITIEGQILGLLIIKLENERIVGSWKSLRIHDQYIGVHQMDNHIEKMINVLFFLKIQPQITP